MNWKAVVDDLREQASESAEKTKALTARVKVYDVEGMKLIERHRIQANFCIGLADALEAGIEGA
jgi:hypothetical protein